ncbi:MAG: PQQ-binding-like beta-propeller repeat protein [Acidobacteriota bacterium]
MTRPTPPLRAVSIGALLALFTSAATVDAAEDNWPQFRGPTMNSAIDDNPKLPERWSRTENVEWIADVPGIGWSSPVVWGDRVFLTTVTSDRAYEEPKPGLYAPRGRTDPPAVRHDWLVYCLDLASGEVLWKESVFGGVPEFPRHQKNSYASETPTTDGERVYVRFGDLGIWAFDLDGKLAWEKRIPFKKTMSDWGSASSLVLAEGKLIVLYDNEEESWLAALDGATGNELWRAPRDEVSSWATPFVWRNELRTEIVTSGRKKIRSYDLDGNVLWEMDGRMSWAAIATPFAAHGLLYVTSGYFQDSHRPVYAIKPGASGDITPSEDGDSDFVAWYQPRAGNYNTSPLVYGDNYYSLLDRGFFEAYDARSGEPVYGRNRVAPRGGASFTASPWAYNGKIFALSEQGDTYVIEAGSEFSVAHVNSLDEMAMASPAIVGDRVLLRTRSKLYSLKEGAQLAQAERAPTQFVPLGTTGFSWGAWINPGAPVEEWLPRARPLCGEEELCQVNVFEGPELATHEEPVPAANLRGLKWVATFRHGQTPRVVVEEFRAEPGQEKRRLTFDE